MDRVSTEGAHGDGLGAFIEFVRGQLFIINW
jgi:hypothetical protein